MPTNPPKNFPALWASAWGEDSYGYWQAFEIKKVRQVMRWIPAGEFLMGSPEDEAERFDNEKQHKVSIQQGFWLADTACTQALWQVLMGDNPSHFTESSQNPVESISWDDCQVFIEKANHFLQMDWLALPTEQQWEYACRAGTSTPFTVGESITTNQANFDGNYPYKNTDKKGIYRKKTVPVLTFLPNSLGLFQMHGNVWEWCDDIYREDYSGKNTSEGDDSQRVLRGGSWLNYARSLRSASRYADAPDFRSSSVGLRLAGGGF